MGYGFSSEEYVVVIMRRTLPTGAEYSYQTVSGFYGGKDEDFVYLANKSGKIEFALSKSEIIHIEAKPEE